MAKGARSNSQKQLRTWKRQKLVPKWQQEADERRYAALAAAAASAPVPADASAAVDTEERMHAGTEVPARGRAGKQAAAADAMDEDLPVKRQGKKGQGKGAPQGTASGGVKKKGRTRKIGKLTMIGKTEFGKGSKRKGRK